MKTLVITAMTALFLCGQGFAGDTAKQVVDTPTLSEWFVGGTVEYFDDADNDLYTLKIGKRFYQTEKFSWSLFGEVGFADKSTDKYYSQYIPVTFNGDARYNLTDKFAVYAGAGLGTSYNKLNLHNGGDNESQWNMVYQVFTGVAYSVTSAFELNVGARYTWVIDDIDSEISDDLSYGVGATWSF